ncbi:hypothetical protein BZA05DRAFT_107082 [Tricharina praecox]|uniref:uncharacterized protein n=1 Tax=Tricharina praecox TaxID=43433 RepID=UPI00222000F7|nr:uncharacterized protein BZA05DRAFT_107082 [Tricharina praecox]KAI5857805.1 hypothetical protein BZA05DRAFT_107082 [Tricharina praecox]
MKIIADGFLTTLTPETVPRALGLGFISMIATGWTSVSLIICVQLACEDRNIGLATLLCGCARAIGGSVVVTIYSSLLTNKIADDSGPRVAKVVVPLGFKIPLLPKLIGYLSHGDVRHAAALPGATPGIIEVAAKALQWSWSEAFKLVYISATVFAGLSLAAALFVQDVSHNMTDNVAVRLANEKERVNTVDA